MKTNKNIFKLLLLLPILATIFNGCNDCDLVGTTYPCRVREGTIPLFDPRLIYNQIDTLTTIVPTYNNQTFQFPNDNSSSGTLTNDNRYDTGDTLGQYYVIDSRSYNDPITGELLSAKLLNIYPPNPSMVGDAMVVSVAPDFSYALVRFFGSVARFPQPFNFEDAYRFCNEYLPGYKQTTGDDEFTNIASQSTIWGSAIAFNNPTPAENNVRITNALNQDVTSQYLNTIPQNILNELGSNKQTTGVDVQVRVGDVYYYRARNGKEFAVIVSNIFEGSLDPFIKRVTIRFSELKGKGQTECPTN